MWKIQHSKTIGDIYANATVEAAKKDLGELPTDISARIYEDKSKGMIAEKTDDHAHLPEIKG